MTHTNGAGLLAVVDEALAELDAVRGDDHINRRQNFDTDLERLRADPSNADLWMLLYLDVSEMWEHALCVARPDTVALYKRLKSAVGEGILECDGFRR